MASLHDAFCMQVKRITQTPATVSVPPHHRAPQKTHLHLACLWLVRPCASANRCPQQASLEEACRACHGRRKTVLQKFWIVLRCSRLLGQSCAGDMLLFSVQRLQVCSFLPQRQRRLRRATLLRSAAPFCSDSL